MDHKKKENKTKKELSRVVIAGSTEQELFNPELETTTAPHEKFAQFYAVFNEIFPTINLVVEGDIADLIKGDIAELDSNLSSILKKLQKFYLTSMLDKSIEASTINIKINLTSYYISVLLTCATRRPMVKIDFLYKAIRTIKSIPPTHMTAELAWYYAFIITKIYFENPNKQLPDDIKIYFNEWLNCLRIMNLNVNYQKHAKNMAHKVANFLKELSIHIYPTVRIYEQLDFAAPPRLSFKLRCVEDRHEFIKYKYRHVPYLNYNFKLLTRIFSQPITIQEKAVDSFYAKKQFQEGSIFKKITLKNIIVFTTLMFPNSHTSMFYLPLGEKYKLLEHNLNCELRIFLIREKFLDSTGGLIHKKFFKKTNNNGKKQIEFNYDTFYVFENAINDFLGKFGSVFKKDGKHYKPFDLSKQKTREALLNKFYIDQIDLIAAGFVPEDALLLSERFLVKHQYGLEENILNKIKQAILYCFNILHHSKHIFTEYSTATKYEYMFNFAKTIVKNLLSSKNSVLISVGVPDTMAGHVIYVVLKYQQIDDTIQVIISNAGYGVNKFHKKYNSRNTYDIPEYYYAAFKPLSTSEDDIYALQNYVYKILMLRHEHSVKSDKKADKKDSKVLDPMDADNLIGNIYLRTGEGDSQDFFIGYNDVGIYNFKRQDSQNYFEIQPRGNCTIHNLKYALKEMFDLDIVNFGLLQDNLFIGLAEFIATNQELQALKVPQLSELKSNKQNDSKAAQSSTAAGEESDLPWLVPDWVGSGPKGIELDLEEIENLSFMFEQGDLNSGPSFNPVPQPEHAHPQQAPSHCQASMFPISTDETRRSGIATITAPNFVFK